MSVGVSIYVKHESTLLAKKVGRSETSEEFVKKQKKIKFNL